MDPLLIDDLLRLIHRGGGACAILVSCMHECTLLKYMLGLESIEIFWCHRHCQPHFILVDSLKRFTEQIKKVRQPRTPGATPESIWPTTDIRCPCSLFGARQQADTRAKHIIYSNVQQDMHLVLKCLGLTNGLLSPLTYALMGSEEIFRWGEGRDGTSSMCIYEANRKWRPSNLNMHAPCMCAPTARGTTFHIQNALQICHFPYSKL
jgi:hypothetical protein